ncbi:hypothetical protein ANN_08107 [Periplaneta americana]|uniref:Uncharacterized protein n=1 Tax=Periplaneta americana TaxID=6978 RepID=A0ABQ8T0I7_PERAM|nr:hypothetical protein ANN_08107 [Periplaneta americana]
MGRACSTYGRIRNAYRVLVGRPEGKRPLGRPRRRWEDNIKMDLREVGYDDRDWINLAQDRDRWRAYVRAAMNLRVRCIHRTAMSLHESENWGVMLEASYYAELETNYEQQLTGQRRMRTTNCFTRGQRSGCVTSKLLFRLIVSNRAAQALSIARLVCASHLKPHCHMKHLVFWAAVKPINIKIQEILEIYKGTQIASENGTLTPPEDALETKTSGPIQQPDQESKRHKKTYNTT